MDQILGKKGRDKITGYEGIIVGKIEYLYGCNQYGITAPQDKDGKLQNTQWFDEGRIEITGQGVKPADVQVKDPGGDSSMAPIHY